MDRSDEALYESFITRNNEEAIRLLFDRYCDLLTCFIQGMVHNPDDAEEIMMDCFAIVVAATSRFTGRGGSSFKTWLYAVATKRARMFLRKNHMTGRLEDSDDLPADELALPENGFLASEQRARLYNAMHTLPADQRTVLYLRFFEEMKPEEISRVMKKSVKQIYKLTDRGKRALRELLAGSETEGNAIWDI